VPAADVVAKAAPDGLTLLLATSSIASTGPAVNPALPYDVERDFTPLSLLAVSPSLVLVSTPCPRRPWRSSSPGRGRGAGR
jgi:tripartite-type tricarboxylate transporter receptor subunit TctC